jgi:hypothetical protein
MQSIEIKTHEQEIAETQEETKEKAEYEPKKIYNTKKTIKQKAKAETKTNQKAVGSGAAVENTATLNFTFTTAADKLEEEKKNAEQKIKTTQERISEDKIKEIIGIDNINIVRSEISARWGDKETDGAIMEKVEIDTTGLSKKNEREICKKLEGAGYSMKEKTNGRLIFFRKI